jgi:hypothetical protein
MDRGQPLPARKGRCVMRLPSRVATTFAAVVCALAVAAPAAGAAVRHAAPGAGGPEPCAAAAPCGFADAVSGASAGDEVVVAPGNHVVSSLVQLTADSVVVRGPAAAPRPRVSITGSTLLFVAGSGVTVRDLRLEAADAPSEFVVNDLDKDNLYERVEVVATGTTGGGMLLRDGSTVRDSVVWAQGPDATAVVTGSFVLVPVTGARLERVTAIGGSGAGKGVSASSCFGDKQRVTLVDVIARAGGEDVLASEICDIGPDPGPPAIEVHVGSSNAGELVADSGAEIHDLGGNQTAAPVFADAAGGDFHQLAGSPTIDAGTGPVTAGALDLDLQPRLLGSAPDIGADEFALAPLAVTGTASTVSQAGAVLGGTVDTSGLPTTYHFQYGPTAAYGLSTPALSTGSGAVSAPVTDLLSDTAYHFRIVAENAAGTTVGSDATFRTAAATAAVAPVDTGPPIVGPIDMDPPVVGPISMSRRRFAVSPRRTPVSARRKPRGTAFRFSLSEDARVTVAIQRALRGRRANGRCSLRAGRGRRCTVHRRVGSLVRTRAAGTARVAFSGRIGRKALRPGRYRATVRASDAAGNAARPRTIAFVVVRR